MTDATKSKILEAANKIVGDFMDVTVDSLEVRAAGRNKSAITASITTKTAGIVEAEVVFADSVLEKIDSEHATAEFVAGNIVSALVRAALSKI